MRTSAREKYGSGPSLSTRQDRIGRAGFIIGAVIGFIIFMVAKWT